MADLPDYPRYDQSEGQDRITLGELEGAGQLNKFGFRVNVNTTDGDAMIIADDTTFVGTTQNSESLEVDP